MKTLLSAASILALLTACAEKPQTTAASTGAGTAVAAPTIVPGSEEDLVKNVGDRVFFAFDKSILTSDDKATLDRQAAWLAKYPNVNVQIAGNCDERGTEEYNIALGQRRANAARDYLVAKGTAASRITTISYGKERPQPDALCHEESCWAKNRNAITSVQ
jgi:peptidoglycan-associated lipoprotein